MDEFNEILKDIDTKVNVVQNNLSTPNLSVSEGLKYDVYAKGKNYSSNRPTD